MTIVQPTNTLSDLTHLAPNMVSAAIAVTAGKMHLDSPDAATTLLEQDHPVAVAYFRHELARQIAALLLQICGTIDAVYEEHDVPDGDELAPTAVSLAHALRLYMLVSNETAATYALIDGLSDALGGAMANQIGRLPRQVIDYDIVDDRGSHLLRARAMGYRPAPLLLASRGVLAARDR